MFHLLTVLLLAAQHGGVAQASLDANHTAGQHTAQAVGGEARAEDALWMGEGGVG